ncbi:hypothetical protein ACYT69_11400, partial [Streptococcus pyogenes]
PNILTAYRTRISVGDVLTVKNPNGTEAKVKIVKPTNANLLMPILLYSIPEIGEINPNISAPAKSVKPHSNGEKPCIFFK